MRKIFRLDDLLKTEWHTNRVLLNYWVLLLALVFIGSFMPLSTIIHQLLLIDTIAHLILYSILSFIPMILLRHRKTALLLSLSMTPIGYLLESFHIIITGDSFSAINVLANNAGVFTGITTGFIVRLKRHYSQADEKI